MKVNAWILLATIFISTTAHAESFSKYSAPVYKGAIAKPNFNSLKGSENYKTRISNGAKDGVNFAGHYALVNIGCGTECSFSYLVDVRSGTILEFPFGGDFYRQLGLDYRSDSSLIKIDWAESIDGDYEKKICIREEHVLERTRFYLTKRTIKTGYCD